MNDVRLLNTKLDQPIPDLLTSEVWRQVEEQPRQSRAEIEQSFKNILKKNQLQLQSQMIDSNTDTTSIVVDCRKEMMEQCSSRDCLMILGLEEEQGRKQQVKNTTRKVVETAKAMGAKLSADKISISDRVFTRYTK